MNKKILLIIILAFIVIITTGCTANYTLKYEDGTFTEYLNVVGETEDDAHPTYSEIKENGLYADINKTELFTLEPESSRYDVVLTHTLETTKLDKLKAVSECFNLTTYEESENYYYLSLYGGFTCSYLTNSTFTLETNANVTINNAHKIEGNKYIWYLEEDKLEEGITFQVMTPAIDEVKIESDTMISTWGKVIIVIIILIISGFLITLLKKVNEG